MKIAFIGGYGHMQLRPILSDAAFRISATAMAGDGVDDAQARTVGQARLGDHQWFPDAHEMLRKFKPDLINVGAVYERNACWAMAAMEAGVPVLCEKPIATTRAQLAQLKETAERTGGFLFTEFSFRCRPSVLAAHQAVQAGRIGEVVLATGQKSYKFGGKRPAWYGDRAIYGGTIGWVASHAIDALWFCTRCPFTEVTGRQGNLGHREYPGLEDHTVSLFRLANGGSGMVHADFLRPAAAPSHGDDRLRIVGTAGQVEVRNNQTILISDREGVRDLTSQAEPLTMHGQMLDAINGRPSVLSTADSLYIAEVLLAAREAADTGTWVRIGPPC